MLRSRFLAILSCLAFLTGCATTVAVQIKRAPEISLANVKSLKVEPFDVSGHLSLDLGESHHGQGTVVGALVGMAVDAGANRMAEARHPEFQAAELAGLKEIIFKDGFYQVKEGEDADARVTGMLHYTVTDSGEPKAYKDNNGKMIYYFEFTRRAQVEVKFNILDNAGTVVGASEVRTTAARVIREENRERARLAAPAWDEVVREALTYTAEPFIRKIAPYFVTERRTFEDGEADVIKAGNKAAGNGDWGTAEQCWKTGEGSSNPKDKIAALYNLGIYDEVQGRLNDALDKFTQVQKLSGDAKYLNDIRRTQARIEEEKQLQAIGSASSTPGSGDEMQAWIASPGLQITREKDMHHFTWTPVPHAVGYHVFTARGKDPLSQLNHSVLTQPQLRAKALPRGKTLVQVVAFDQDGNELAKSQIQTADMP